ncbi:MAG: hypothetical protein FJ087_19140 [Deltaproteobacteria bacterium]|nr:hypothetical protein [Deltaproteobacteria bacterium]
MAAKGKLTRKEIKGPDEFQTNVAKALEVMNLYRGWIIAGVTLILVAIVGGVVLSRFGERSRIDTAVAFDRAFSPVLAATLDRTAPADDEDAAKKLAAAAETAGKVKAAMADLDRFAASNASKPVAKAATLAKAAAAFHVGEAEAAMGAWRTVLGAGSAGAMDFVLWESLGNAADAAGKADEAERAYSEMAKNSSSLARATAYLRLGDLRNPATRAKAGEGGDAAKARDAYEKGVKELGGEESLMGAAEALTKKTLQHRLLSLR